MHPSHIHWKIYLLPGVMAAVSIWTFYMGAVALFSRPMISDEVDSVRSGQRVTASDTDCDLVRRESVSPDSSDSPRATTRAESNAAHTSKSNQAARGITARQQGKQQSTTPANTANSHGEARLSKHDPKPSATSLAKSVLRRQLISEAVNQALRSEQPWKNLLAVSAEQYRRGELDDARSILILAEKRAYDPDEQLKSSRAMREIIKAMLSQKQREDALLALQNIQDIRERDRAIGEMAAWSARKGNVKMARNIMTKIANASERDTALVSIAENEASYEGTSAALQTVIAISSQHKKDEALHRIALKRGALRDYTGADQAMQLLRNNKLKDATTATLARLRAKSGDVSGALLSLHNIDDQALTDIVLRELVQELAKLGRFSTGAYVATRIHDKQEISYALGSISIEQARAGDLSGSLVRSNAIPVDSVRERTLTSVSKVTADQGNPARARNVAIRIDSPQERDRAYRAIAQAAAEDGDHVTAYNTLQSIRHPDEKALALVSMARMNQKQGRTRQALALLEDANRETLEVSSVRVSDRIQSDMAVAYAERQEASHSLRIADHIRDTARRDTTYGSLARTLAGTDIDAAQQSLESISSEKLRLVAEDAVARTLARKVAPRQALHSSRSLTTERQRIIFLLEVSRKI